ncbi:MAG: hypothetical protein BMS9Abin25_0724 [Gammaproteobacteria bacterium]|nr:MAG: hypothetical protein BMS9Abin25_0724 [Gammaproteobacteria bacterium]
MPHPIDFDYEGVIPPLIMEFKSRGHATSASF